MISNFIISINPLSQARKPKSSIILNQRKNFVKSVRKQYGNPGLHAFFLLRTVKIKFKYSNFNFIHERSELQLHLISTMRNSDDFVTFKRSHTHSNSINFPIINDAVTIVSIAKLITRIVGCKFDSRSRKDRV